MSFSRHSGRTTATSRGAWTYIESRPCTGGMELFLRRKAPHSFPASSRSCLITAYPSRSLQTSEETSCRGIDESGARPVATAPSLLMAGQFDVLGSLPSRMPWPVMSLSKTPSFSSYYFSNLSSQVRGSERLGMTEPNINNSSVTP